MKSSDDESINLATLSVDEILEIAKGKPAAMKKDGLHRSKWITLKGIIRRLFFGRAVYIMRCVFCVSMDPLFMYIPIINEDMKCLTLDKKLNRIALSMRSLTDLPYIAQIIIDIKILMSWRDWAVLKKDKLSRDTQNHLCLEAWKQIINKFWQSLLIDTFAALPIPQIAMLVLWPRMSGSRSLNGMKIFNTLILLQYVARARPIYLFCKEFNRFRLEDKGTSAGRKSLWIPGVINFFMYILASHVLGAFWYFFSIQREIDCWVSACRSENGCELNIFHCDNSSFKNITLLNDLCPINPPNPLVFDFGIFLYALQSGIVGSTDFPRKVLHCFSWGLRNLSSFASNLNTSAYVWETLFVIFVSISGLLLFIYLLGHLQTFMQATNRTYRIWQKGSIIFPEITRMVSEYGLLHEQSFAIWELARQRLEEEEDLVVDNIFSILPFQLKNHIKRHLFWDTLKNKVPMLQDIGNEALKTILERLEPANYTGGSYIIREGEPLDMMIFITQGNVLTYRTNTGGGSGSSSTIRLASGDFYGQELITWAVKSTPFSDLPISTKTVRSGSQLKVEVFAITATNLQHIVSKFSSNFNTVLPHPTDTLVEITNNSNS